MGTTQRWLTMLLALGLAACTTVEQVAGTPDTGVDAGGAGYTGWIDGGDTGAPDAAPTDGEAGGPDATPPDSSPPGDGGPADTMPDTPEIDVPPAQDAVPPVEDTGGTDTSPADIAAAEDIAPDPCEQHCNNGSVDCGESGLDCGGTCKPCVNGCGDGVCGGGETACMCPGDCSQVCGDGCCTGGESAAVCCGDCGTCCVPADCPACGACANVTCTAGECGCSTAPGCCGNGACDGDESTATCPADCPFVSQGCEGCQAGEVCVLGTCAPVAVLRASGDAAPTFVCPSGYALAGRWRTGPGLVNGGTEAIDAEGLQVDAGWVWLCSAAPGEVRVLAKGNDCGGPSTECVGQKRGSFHVGAGCDQTSAVDAAGVTVQSGWLTLCVSGAHDVRVEVGSDDCGGAAPGCGGPVRGQWHTMPAACDEGITGEGTDGTTIDTGWMHLCVTTSRHAPTDPSTVAGKALFGYQGWFAAPGDGSAVGWLHWAPGEPNASNASFDLWPDTSELGPDELYPTAMTMQSGQPAQVFSSHNPKTVERHFRWMEEAGIDGVFLQRFTSEVSSPPHFAFRDGVTQHVRAAAEAHGRAWAIMIDISGTPEANLIQIVQNDWKHLVEDLKITDSPFYLRQGGKPVLAIWGLGFTDRPGSVAQATELITWLRTGAPAHLRTWLVGGVPFYWRNGNTDSKPGFANVYGAFDAISPWSVGRFDSTGGFDSKKSQVVDGDATKTKAAGQGYAPVVWPGFSWANLTKSPASYNQIPRKGGTFFWHQVKGMLSVAPTFLYVAMFDEVDEATAMFKAATSASQVPAQGQWLHLGADGWSLPSDWYLRLGGAAAKAIAGQQKAAGTLPYQP